MKTNKGSGHPNSKIAGSLEMAKVFFYKKLSRFTDKIKPRWVEDGYIFASIGFIVCTILLSYFVLLPDLASFAMKCFRYLALFIILIKVFFFDFKQYSLKRIILLIFLGSLLLISAFASGNRSLFITGFIILGAYGVDYRRILRNFLIFVGGVYFLTILLSVLGIVPDLTFWRNDAFRHSLGFRWCATPAIFGWSLTTALVYFRKKDISWLELTFLFAINVFLYVLTGTRLELVCAILVIIISLFNKYGLIASKGFLRKVLDFVFLFLPILMVAFSFSTAYFYDSSNPMMKRLNSVTSSRLSLGNKAVYDYGLAVFGNEITSVGTVEIFNGTADAEDFSVVDNSYLLIFLRFGILAGLLVLYFYYRFSKAFIAKDDLLFELLLIVVFAHSFFNPHLTTLAHNVFLLFMPYAFVKPKVEHEKK